MAQQGETEPYFPHHMPLLRQALSWGPVLHSSNTPPGQATPCCTPTCTNCSMSRRNEAHCTESKQGRGVREVNTCPTHSSPSPFSFFSFTGVRTSKYLAFREGKKFPFLVSLYITFQGIQIGTYETLEENPFKILTPVSNELCKILKATINISADITNISMRTNTQCC